MVLHFNEDGTISMRLNIRGKKIEKIFSSYSEYLNYLNSVF